MMHISFWFQQAKLSFFITPEVRWSWCHRQVCFADLVTWPRLQTRKSLSKVRCVERTQVSQTKMHFFENIFFMYFLLFFFSLRIFIVPVVVSWPIVGTFMLHLQMKTVINGTKTHCQFHTQREANRQFFKKAKITCLRLCSTKHCTIHLQNLLIPVVKIRDNASQCVYRVRGLQNKMQKPLL